MADNPLDMYYQFMNGNRQNVQMPSSNPLLSSVAQGQSLPGMNEWSRILPNHPRLSAALENAGMMMSMIPGADTTGGNISQVAGAFLNLPQARMNRAAAMLAPGMELDKFQTDQLKSRAGSFLDLMQGNYYNQRQGIEDADRKQREQQALAMLHGGMADNVPKFGSGVAPSNDPSHRWAKGDTVYGNYKSQWDETKGYPTQVFEPTHTKAEGEQLNSMGLYRQPSQWMVGVQGILDTAAAAGKPMTEDEAMKEYQSRVALNLFGVHQGAPPSVADITNKELASASAADQTSYKNAIYSTVTPTSEEVAAEYFKQSALDPNYDATSAFSSIPADRQKNNAKVNALWAKHQRLPVKNRVAFDDYLKENGYNPETRSFAGSVATTPQHSVGDTVMLRNGSTVKIKSINSDGTFTY